jgi:hypothetical protein
MRIPLTGHPSEALPSMRQDLAPPHTLKYEIYWPLCQAHESTAPPVPRINSDSLSFLLTHLAKTLIPFVSSSSAPLYTSPYFIHSL